MALTSRTLPPEETLTNAEVHHLLGLKVATEMLGATEPAIHVEIGPLSSNHFSFTFSVKVGGGLNQRNAFVKIPKLDLRHHAPTILPISQGDLKMALEEESSLRLLARDWDGVDLEVNWVRLCGSVPEYNALVTERIFAEEAFTVFRRFDLRRRVGFWRDTKRLRGSMARIGAALGRFHRTNVRPATFRLSEAMPKYEFYCQELSASSGSAWPERILRKLHSMGDMHFASTEVPTLKGLDIRNVLIDEQDRLFLLDPGRTKFTYREADLSRFLMTYRILYWGSKFLPVLRQPDRKAEAAMLGAYYADNQPPSGTLLSLFLLKEQLKHWHTALDSLRLLHWPTSLKRLALCTYVNPFYIRQIATTLNSLTK